VVALVPPIALAFVQFENPWYAVALAVLLIGLRVVWIDFVEIRYSGKQLNVNPLLLLLALGLFGLMWGVVGMVLAVPLVTTVKIILAGFPQTRHYAVLLSEE
jgi:AI-2 transport protein TqsA